MQGAKSSLSALLLCVLVYSNTATAASDASNVYYCLEDYKPVGSVLREVPVNSTTAAADSATASNSTSGQVARQCAAACDAAQECTGFRAVGPEVQGGSSCELLANSTESLPAALAFGPSTPWPEVNANITAADNIALRSISWMCWWQQKDWDAFGQATHNMIVTGNIQGAGKTFEHTDWCAFGVDVAGTNLRRDFINITHPGQCDDICRTNTTGCTMWIFVASRPEQVQFQPAMNCFAKADAFRGQNGWTGKPKGDIWIADSQVTCFNNLPDWRHLGLVLSPSIKTIEQGGSYYTVYPERVTWSEAAATCKQLPGGQLAILDSQGLVDQISRDLLDTLPFQTAVRSAWVGAGGNNTAYNPAAPKLSDLAAEASGGNSSLRVQLPPREQPSMPPEATLKWTNGAQVAPGLLRRPDTLTQLWTVHDVVWSQQYVPESSQNVCGRVMVQLPPSTGPVNPASILPGVWYYDCDKPSSFICQSTSPPSEPMSGREVTPSKVAESDPDRSGSGGGGGLQPWKTALAVILPVLVVALLAFQVFHVYSRKMSRLPELIRQQRKRALGQPRTGRMSLVMTDIQSFTKLMENNADHTTQALLLHNSVIKHAVYHNVGWVVEQEGDSFSVVFHEAEDAVAFTLQVQQALLQQSWPRGVAYDDDWEGATSFLDCRTASQQQPDEATSVAVAEAGTPQRSQPESFSWHVDESDPSAAAVAAGEASQASSCSMGLAAMGQQLLSLRPGRRSSSFTAASAGKGAGHRRSHSMDNGNAPDQQAQQLEVPERLDSTVSAISNSSARIGAVGAVNESGTSSVSKAFQRTGRQSSVTSDDSRSVWHWGRGNSPSTLAPSSPSFGTGAPAGSGLHPHSKKSVLGSRPRNLWLLQQLLSPRQEQQKLFSGLRVRMGVVTGEVERGQELNSSALYRNAQDVTNAAHGGQVLLDEHTFVAVKETMWRLGAVGPNGLDYDALLATKSARHSMSSSSSGGCLGDGCLPALGPGGSLRRDNNTMSEASQLPSTTSNLAVALDMGCYEVLKPSDPANPGRRNSSSSGDNRADGKNSRRKGTPCVQLWTKELGDKLVHQYQQYIQLQLSRQGDLDLPEEGLDNSFDEEAPCMAHARLGALQHQHQQRLQQQHQHQGLAGLRQLSVVGRSSSRSLGGPSGYGAEISGQLSRKQQQQQSPHGMVGRSASMTVPHSWQQMTSSLFGVGVMPTGGATEGAGGGVVDGHLGISKADRHSLIGFCSISAVPRRNVRLYQLVAPTLAGRAALFGQQLDLPPAWRILDPPYFAAPGLTSASLLAAQEAAASETAAAGVASVDGGSDQMRARVPGRMSSESAPWQQRLSGRMLSGDPYLSAHQQQQQQQLQQRRARSAQEGALVAAVQQAAAGTDAPAAPATPSPTAALLAGPHAVVAGAADGAGEGGAQAAAAAGQPRSLSASTPFLSASQQRLSSLENEPAGDSEAIAAAAATAAAAVGQQQQVPGGNSSRQVSALQPQAGTAHTGLSDQQLLRMNSHSTHGGQLGQLTPYQQQQQQQQRPGTPLSPNQAAAAAAAAGRNPSQSLLVLRAASLQLNVAPSVLLASSNGDRRGAGGQRVRASGPARALFPPVTILFATVEGSGELLRYPALARSVHAMVHHLMLQLLRAFPGSYLVRAQQGDLKYMLAFTSPAAAVSWGLTLQEASLYLPYPQEVLGLGSFGVQLDEGGRLVFRGPRFAMGLSEGTPKVIMPDHLGRADYHGSFVNLAARYAAVAAQGGQLVTDAELARQILWHWKTNGHSYANGHTNSYSYTNSLASQGLDGFGSGLGGIGGLRSQPSGASTGQQWSPLMQQQQQASPRALPAAGTAAAEPLGADVDSSDATNSHVLVIQPDDSTAVSVSAAGPGACSTTGTGGGGTAVATAGATADVPVECCWLGSFLFKGNPSPVSMVNFSPAVLSGRHYAPPALSSSKGVRVLQRVGVMDRAVVRLPAAVEGFGPWEELSEGYKG